MFETPNGTQAELVDQNTNGAAYPIPNACQQIPSSLDAGRGTIFHSTDGSAMVFVSDATVLDYTSFGFGEADTKVSGVLRFSNGVNYRIDDGHVSWIRDRNGNRIDLHYTTSTLAKVTWYLYVQTADEIVDPLGRVIKINYSDSSCNGCTTITYPGNGGVSRMIQIVQKHLAEGLLRDGGNVQTANQLFPGNTETSTYSPVVPSYIQFPDGRQFTFRYNLYGEVARINLPTGGAIEYDYGDGHNSSGSGLEGVVTDNNPVMVYRRLQERREYAAGGSSLTSKTHYAVSYPIGQTVDTQGTYNPSGTLVAQTAHTMTGSPLDALNLNGTGCNAWNEGLETRTASGTPTTLVTVDNTYAPQSGCMSNPQLTAQITTLDSNQVSKVTFAYDSYNNVIDKTEYDYGAGVPGAKLRETTTTYVTIQDYLNLNLVHLPETVTVMDASGTAVAKTRFGYDEYNQGSTGPLVAAANVVQHDSGYGTGFAFRGNLTNPATFLFTSGGQVPINHVRQYDTAGNVVRQDDPNGNHIYFSYNDTANEYAWPTTITNALGQTTTASYDYNIGKPLVTTDRNGGSTVYTYGDASDPETDALDRVIKVVYPNGGTTVYSYPDVKTVTTKQDQTTVNDRLLQTKSVYDGLGRLTERDTYEGATYIATTQTYNAQGLVETTKNPSRTGDSLDFTTSYLYDSLGRQKQVKTPDNAVATTTYSGSYTVSEDQAHHKRATLADGLGRTKTAVEDPDTLNLSTSYSYDTLDNLTLVTQGVTCPDTSVVVPQPPTAGCRYYTYDSLSRLIKSVQPESGKVSYSYDAASNLYQRTDARGLVTTYSYDGLNRILQQSYTGGTLAVSYTYDSAPNGKGMLATAANGNSVTNYLAYDAMGEVVSSNQVTGGQTYPFSYGYNLAGALTSETYPSGRVLTMMYDPAGRTSQVAGAKGGNTTTYVSNLMYAPQGAPTQYKYGNDVWRQATYNNRLQPDTTTDQVSNSPSNLLLKLTWSWGGTSNNGNLVGLNANHGGLSFNQAFGYDPLNRLQTASDTGGWSRTFDYDRYGNLWTDPVYTGPAPGAPAAYNSANHVIGGSYDAAGNQILLGASAVTYDAENRQTSVTDPPNVMTGTETYWYDALGQRVKKSGPSAATVYVYDALGQLAAEYSTASVTAPCLTCYLSADHLGSARLVTDALAHVIGRHDFFPFGEEVGANSAGRNGTWGPNTDNIYQRFTGQERDQETGLDFLQARYYASAPGRFLSPDPGNAGADPANPQSWNAYAYVGNSPLVWTDPNGQFLSSAVGAAAGGPVGAAIGAIIDIFGALFGLFGGGDGGAVAAPPPPPPTPPVSNSPLPPGSFPGGENLGLPPGMKIPGPLSWQVLLGLWGWDCSGGVCVPGFGGNSFSSPFERERPSIKSCLNNAFGVPGLAAGTVTLGSVPTIATRTKIGESPTWGTSAVSIVSRRLLPQKIPSTWAPTIGNLGARSGTLGGVVGRWAGWAGVAITAYQTTNFVSCISSGPSTGSGDLAGGGGASGNWFF